jgi:GNAT superfamily N-acetyltransferase
MEDLGVLSEFRLEFVRMVKSLSDSSAELYRAEQSEMFKHRMQSDDFHVWVFERGCSVLGTCALDTHFEDGSGELSAVFTRHDHRREGIAIALVGRAIEYAKEKGLNLIRLQPTESSLELYRKIGFSHAGGRMELTLREDLQKPR